MRLKLIAALRRNNIEVTAEIERSPAGSGRREHAGAFTSHITEVEPVQLVDESADAFLVLISGWILGWNRNQPLRKIQHRWLGEPFTQSEGKLFSI